MMSQSMMSQSREKALVSALGLGFQVSGLAPSFDGSSCHPHSTSPEPFDATIVPFMTVKAQWFEANQ